jgi:hypothetical protein
MHTRAAISANSLPLGVSVEVDAIFELNWITFRYWCNLSLNFSFYLENKYFSYQKL